METLLSRNPWQGADLAQLERMTREYIDQGKQHRAAALAQFGELAPNTSLRPQARPEEMEPARPQAREDSKVYQNIQHYGKNGIPSRDEMVSYIRSAAQQRGIDPDIAVKVAESEGLNADPNEAWQSNYMLNGKRERSYGPYQLFIDGGLGNEFMKKTGLDPRDASTWAQQVDFSLDHASKNGWGAWYGAARVGLDDMAGIGRSISGYGS